jgi:hypothetical protein
MKKLFLFLILLVATALLLKKTELFKSRPTLPPVTKSSEIFSGIGYVPVDSSQFDVAVLSDQVTAPTRLKLTPDGKFLLVTQITGEVLGFKRTNAGWDPKPQLVTKVDTKAAGFPPDELGLVGLVFSADFATNQRVFLLYSYKESDDKIYNRVSSFQLATKENQLQASQPKLIYQANLIGQSSHQITDGLGVKVNDQAYLLFLIGEGFQGQLAQDPAAHAGKLMVMAEDGSNPKIQALGIRNAYVLAPNPLDNHRRFFIADTGPDKYDRVIYTDLLTDKPLNFNWDGNTESLVQAIPDPTFPQVKDVVILRLPETRTFTGLAAHPKTRSILATVFGQTGSLKNTPGKEIWQGELANLDGQPQIKFIPIITRNPAADGKLGNPIGLEVDPQTGDFFFADILEGRIYQVVMLERR